MGNGVSIYNTSTKASGGTIELNIARSLYPVVVNIVPNILKMAILKLIIPKLCAMLLSQFFLSIFNKILHNKRN